MSSPESLVKKAKDINLKAIALTDHGFLGGMVDFFKAGQKYNMQTLYGVEFYECNNVKIKDKNNRYYHLVVLAKDDIGIQIINDLVTKSYKSENFYYKPRIQFDWLLPYAKHLIITTACLAGRINTLSYSNQITYINYMKKKFPHFYIELQSHDSKDQKMANINLLELANKTNTPYIITTDTHFVNNDLETHKIFKAINQKILPEDLGETFKDCYLQTPKEIYDIMKDQIDEKYINKGLNYTNEIADICNAKMIFSIEKLPKVKLPNKYKDEYEFLVELCKKGWKERNIHKMPKDKQKIYNDRLRYELKTIKAKGYSGYFVIVWDFINYAISQNLIPPVGRGSGAGSLVLYLLKICAIDPLKYDLLFERFLNPDPNDPHNPDIDTDFSHDSRDMVVDYVVDKYGENYVADIGLYNYLQAKAVIKAVGKVLNIPYKVMDNISKSIPDNTSLKEVVQQQIFINKIKPYYDKYDIKTLIETALKLENIPRSYGSHPCGKIISNIKLSEDIGIAKIKDQKVCMYDMNSVENLGYEKFDFLGLKTYSVIQDTIRLINKNYDYIDPDKMNLTDEKVWKEFKQGNTSSIFQFESYAMQEVLQKISVSSIEELTAANALFRPGAMDYINDYVKGKNNPETIKYIHDDLKNILDVTYGQLIYQEQMMNIARLADVPNVDDFRKACGKKIPELMDKQEVFLKNGLKKKGWTEDQASEMWTQIVKFAKYSFNKSHACCYAMIAYITMFLKVHHPVEYMTAVLNSEKGNFHKISKYINEANRLNIKVLSPNINESKEIFSVKDNNILFGLLMIKGVNLQDVQSIIKNRPYNSIDEFFERNDLNITTSISLIKSGCFDNFNNNRKQMLIDYAIGHRFKPNKIVNINHKNLMLEHDIIKKTDFDNKELCLEEYNKFKLKNHIQEFKDKYMQEDESSWEMATLSMYLTTNPFQVDILNQILSPFDELTNEEEHIFVGTIIDVKYKNDKNQNRYCYVDLLDHNNEIIECICWASTYSEYQGLVKKNKKVMILGRKKEDKIFISQVREYYIWIEQIKQIIK